MPAETMHLRTYLKTFAALMLLLVLTVGANFLEMGPFNVAVAMFISVAKALLIVLFFMEVRASRPMIWLAASAGFVWLMLMLVMMLSDYETRPWIGPDWRDGNAGTNHVEFATPH
jgi:cytochrome c oxidase subunit 4